LIALVVVIVLALIAHEALMSLRCGSCSSLLSWGVNFALGFDIDGARLISGLEMGSRWV